MACRELVRRRQVKAALTLQRVFRGHWVRVSVDVVWRSVILIQCVLRRRLAVAEVARVRVEKEAAVLLQAFVRRHQARSVQWQQPSAVSSLHQASDNGCSPRAYTISS